MNGLNQVEFSNLIGISQATLSELEQDKYKPSIDTILAITSQFTVSLEWFLGYSQQSGDKVLGVRKISEREAELLILFDKLKSTDKDEIVDFINLKISRY